MRTQEPASIRADFDSAIVDVGKAFDAADNHVPDDASKKLIAEYAFVSAAALFEGLISDLFVAYINRDSARFRDFLLRHLTIDTSDKYAERAKEYAETTMRHLNVEEIRNVLDPTDYNITFQTTEKMKESAGKWLADSHKSGFVNTTGEQSAVIDYVKAIRNFLAHRSKASDTSMQRALLSCNLPAALKRNQNNVADVGAYLRAQIEGKPRFKHFIDAITHLARQFCP